jgi:hypothetical protein
LVLFTPVNNSLLSINTNISETDLISDKFDCWKHEYVIFDGLKTKSKKNNQTNNNIGNDFIQAITAYLDENNVSRVIIVSDQITIHASKYIEKIDFNIVQFKYSETCILNLNTNFTQPNSYRKLKGIERKEYIQSHKDYKTRLMPTSKNDALVKLYEGQEGDIIEFISNDIQSGFVIEYFIVV